MALAVATDLLTRDYDDDPDAIAGAISWATSAIEGYTGRNFDSDTETAIVTPRDGAAILPNYPVESIDLVEGYLPDPDGAGMVWRELTNYWPVLSTGMLYDSTGLPGTEWMGGPSWPWLPGSLRVTYTYGYSPVPDDLRDVCVRLATQYLANPELMVQRAVGDMSGRFSGSAGAVINEIDRNILDRYSDVGLS